MCITIVVLLLLFTTKVRADEAREDVEDISLRTHPPESSTAVPAQPMYPYPYNIYYPNPYTVLSPHMYNYQRPPYIQSPETSPHQIHPLNPAGYTFKVTEKSTNNEEVPQQLDAQSPSTYQYNRPYHPFEVPSPDKSGVKQILTQQPSSHTSFFQGQTISVANNTETPALNSNTISLQAYRWPSGNSFVSEAPATKMVQSTMAFNTGGNAELIKQPVNRNLVPKTNAIAAETDFFEKIVNSKDSPSSHFLSLNSDVSKSTRSSEETPSETISGAIPVTHTQVPLPESLESNKFSSEADVSGTDYQQTLGASSKEYVRKEISAPENTLDDKTRQNGLSKNSVYTTKMSETVKVSKEQNKQSLDTRDDVPNTLVVQISTVHQDKTIDSPQIDRSGNILFPISRLMNKSKNISNVPFQQLQINDSNNIMKTHGPVTTERNTQTGRRNKILNTITPISKVEQENNAAQLLSLENESTSKQNKSQPVGTRNIVIRLPNGQELVIDLSRSRTSDPISSSGEESGKFELDVTRDQHTSETALRADSGIEEDKLLRENENTDENALHFTMQEGETTLLTSKYSSTEQNDHLSSYNAVYNNENSPVPAYDFLRVSKDLENTNIDHGSDNGVSGATIPNIKHFHHEYSILEDVEDLNTNVGWGI